VGGRKLVLELVLPVFCSCSLAYLQLEALSSPPPKGNRDGCCKLFLCCLFDSPYFSDILLVFYVSSMLFSLGSSVCSLFFVIHTLIHSAQWGKLLFHYHLAINLCFLVR
jgi:hypothetical protein